MEEQEKQKQKLKLKTLIEGVVGKQPQYPHLVDTLVGDVVHWFAWYHGLGGQGEIKLPTRHQNVSLEKPEVRTHLLGTVVKRYVLSMESLDSLRAAGLEPGDAAVVDVVVNAVLERIVYWEDWYPQWAAEADWEGYVQDVNDYYAIAVSTYGNSERGFRGA